VKVAGDGATAPAAVAAHRISAPKSVSFTDLAARKPRSKPSSDRSDRSGELSGDGAGAAAAAGCGSAGRGASGEAAAPFRPPAARDPLLPAAGRASSAWRAASAGERVALLGRRWGEGAECQPSAASQGYNWPPCAAPSAATQPPTSAAYQRPPRAVLLADGSAVELDGQEAAEAARWVAPPPRRRASWREPHPLMHLPIPNPAAMREARVPTAPRSKPRRPSGSLAPLRAGQTDLDLLLQAAQLAGAESQLAWLGGEGGGGGAREDAGASSKRQRPW